MIRTTQQTYISILGSIGKNPSCKEGLMHLPAGPEEARRLTTGFAEHYIYNSSHPLYSSISEDLEDIYCSIHGFFYDDSFRYISKLLRNKKQSVIQIIEELRINLNGNYNGILYTKTDKCVYLFCDTFGFEKLYYTHFQGNFFYSSFIWPLINLLPAEMRARDDKAMAQHMLLGYPLGNRTLYQNIKVLEPDTIIVFDCNREVISIRAQYDTYSDTNYSTENTNPRDFFKISHRQLDYVRKKSANSDIGLTLTGGMDTRVILNGMLHSGIKPKCFVGNNGSPDRDSTRSKKISHRLGLYHKIIDYSNNAIGILPDTMLITNGYSNGIWMANIGLYIQDGLMPFYTGLSGDFIAGGTDFELAQKSIEELAVTDLYQKSMYQSLSHEILLHSMGLEDYDILDDYIDLYSNHRLNNLQDLYYMVEKNNRNFRRTASFGDGAKLGVYPISFYHDLRILAFYRNLPDSMLRYQKFHNKISCYRNKVLSWIPSADNANIPNFMIPTAMKIIPTGFIDRIKNIKAKNQDHHEISYADLEKRYSGHWTTLPEKSNNLFDFRGFHNLIGGKHAGNDLEYLFNRLNEIIFQMTYSSHVRHH